MRGWNGVLNTSMILVSCLYIGVGFFGYLKYGDTVAGSITLNLPVDELLVYPIPYITRWLHSFFQLSNIGQDHDVSSNILLLCAPVLCSG